MKAVILDGYTTNPGDLTWGKAFEQLETKVYDRTDKTDIIDRCKDAEIIITNKVPLTRDTLAELPDVRFIALLSTGYNVVDVDYCTERGIPVSNIPTYSTNSVAQLTFAMLLEITNRVALHNDSVKNGEWTACSDFCYQKSPLTELTGKTFGIIGLGKIGRQSAAIANAFGMKVLAHTENPDKHQDVQNIEIVDLDTLLKNADVVSLHCPLTAKTEGMVDKEFLSKMKSSAILINTSRGPVLDEKAVADALNQNVIAACAADVLSTEPPTADNPLLHCKNCIITPHIAWAAFETRKRLVSVLNENISAFLAGSPVNTVNR